MWPNQFAVKTKKSFVDAKKQNNSWRTKKQNIRNFSNSLKTRNQNKKNLNLKDLHLTKFLEAKSLDAYGDYLYWVGKNLKS